MTTEDNSAAAASPAPKWVRKLVVPALVGAVVGFGASVGLLAVLDSEAIGGLSESATIAALIGLLYAVTGLGLVIGVASPGLGARFLNVEDADELREQKRMLGLSGVAMLLWGGALMALALAAPEGPLPPAAALVIGGAGLGIGAVVSIPAYRASDELMRAVNLEAGMLALCLMFLVLGLWGMLAHLGYAAGPAPLDLLSLFYGIGLLASFIIVGKRGMLMPR